MNKHYPKVEFNVSFKAPNEIGKFFSYKDRIEDIEKKSRVIYQINCAKKGCDATNIGKKKWILVHRLKEHNNSKESACRQHEIDNPGHLMDYKNVEILDSATSNAKVLVKELLQIISRQPNLNIQLNSKSKFNIKALIIAAHPQHLDEDVTNKHIH